MRIFKYFTLALIAFITTLVATYTPLQLFNIAFNATGNSGKWASDVAYGNHQRHKLDIYAPLSHSNRNDQRAVVVFLHGGSWNSGSRQEYKFAAKALADSGFMVVVPDYRLYPEVRFPEFLHDNAKAFAWVQKHIAEYGGDPKNIALVGISAGAYNATMLSLDNSYLAPFGLSPAHIKAVVSLAGPYDFSPQQTNATRNSFGDHQPTNQTQPIHFAALSTSNAEASPKFMLATGSDDRFVSATNTRNLAHILREKNLHTTEIHYPNLGHIGLLLSLSAQYQSRAPVLNDVVGFLRGALVDTQAKNNNSKHD